MENIREIKKEEMLRALRTEEVIGHAFHRPDNTFIRCEFELMLIKITEQHLKPLGFQSVGESSRLAFILYDEENGMRIWVHVPKTILKGWILQSGIDTASNVFFSGD